jgi:hypothetical protein
MSEGILHLDRKRRQQEEASCNKRLVAFLTFTSVMDSLLPE